MSDITDPTIVSKAKQIAIGVVKRSSQSGFDLDTENVYLVVANGCIVGFQNLSYANDEAKLCSGVIYRLYRDTLQEY